LLVIVDRSDRKNNFPSARSQDLQSIANSSLQL
jgi:hypothetical protein